MLFFAQCIKEPDANGSNLIDDFDRKEMLLNLSDNYIIPGYQNYSNKIVSLETSVVNFEQNNTLTNLQDLETKYYACVLAWQKVSFLEFGPAENIQFRTQTNVYPVDSTLILTNISDGGYNLGAVSNITAKGWQTLDFLLFHKGNSSNTLNFFNADANRLLYLKDVVEDLKVNAEYVLSGWTNSYRSEFTENNANNANGSAVSDMTNAIVSHYEAYIRKGKIGLPVGVFNGFSQSPMPQHVEGLYLGVQLQYAQEVMNALKKFVNGQHFNGSTDGLGLLDYANFVGALSGSENLSTAVNAQIDRILVANDLCTDPWSIFIQQSPIISGDIYISYQKLIPLLKIDLTSALGIIITYQDNDGD